MSFSLRALYYSLVGGWGGFLAWLFLDCFLHASADNHYAYVLINGAVVGAFIGALVLSCEGMVERRATAILQGLFFGGFCGLLGGMTGVFAGEFLFQTFHRGAIWRILGWTLFGLGIGLADGAVTRSRIRALQGACGGALGGILGGSTFLLLNKTAGLPMTSRAIGFVLLGLFLGFCIGLVQILLKTAWLKVISSGPQEGKEFDLSKAVTVIGRNNGFDVRLLNDSSINARQAEIRQEKEGFVFYNLATDLPVRINNLAVQKRTLANNDQIMIGSYTLLFRDKSQT